MVNEAINILRRYEPTDGYHLAFSGGKDSICCYQLCKLAGVKYKAVYSITTVDNPTVLPFIRKNYPDVIFDRPKLSMFQLIVKKRALPTRINRFCCEHLKEYSGIGKTVITGVRNEESNNRKKRRLLELDSRKNKCYVNPIIKFKQEQVFEFIKYQKLIIPDYYYDCLTARGGCIGCPMNSNLKQQFKLYPKFEYAYKKSIKKVIENGGFKKYKDVDDVFNWWVSGESFKNYTLLKKQTKLDL